MTTQRPTGLVLFGDGMSKEEESVILCFYSEATKETHVTKTIEFLNERSFTLQALHGGYSQLGYVSGVLCWPLRQTLAQSLGKRTGSRVTGFFTSFVCHSRRLTQ